MKTIPHLKALYGDRYRVGLDPAADGWRDPWMMTIPTRTGEVYPHSPAYAAVEVKARCYSIIRPFRERFAVHQDGSDVVAFLVPWAELDDVLPLLKPYRQRRLSAAERERLITATKATRFKSPRT